MSRYFILFLLIVLFSAPVFAQDSAVEDVKNSPAVAPVVKEQDASAGKIESADNAISDAEYEERLKLSKQMHKIWPVRPKIERALDAIAEQIEPQNRMKFKSAMRKAIDFGSVEQGSIEAMADVFTADELKAMIEFYGSKEGRSVSFKTDDYQRALQPILVKMLDKALLDTKLGQ